MRNPNPWSLGEQNILGKKKGGYAQIKNVEV